jgi:glucose-1-phosphate adenylyltransferase
LQLPERDGGNGAGAGPMERGLERRLVVMVLAGGMGERLLPITSDRSKPAVPFGGNFRIIDFTLNNCVMSGIRRMYVLTQYHALSLNRHLRDRWSFLPKEMGEFIEGVPSKLRTPSGVYQGTADAIFRNLDILEEHRPEVVLILSGDHVYRADYTGMVRHHLETGADATVLVGEVEAAEATQFGVVRFQPDGRISSFVEKPADPSPLADERGFCSINLGIYCFGTRFLVQRLVADAKKKTAHDLGKNILPTSVDLGKVVSYPLSAICPDPIPYWRDVGSIDSYFAASMDLLDETPAFELRDPRWPSGSRFEEWLPASLHTQAREGGRSIISPGVVVGRAEVSHAILSPGVVVEDGASLDRAVLFSGVRVGRGAKLRRVIVESGVSIPPGVEIGYGDDQDYTSSPGGVVVIARGHPFSRSEASSPDPSEGQPASHAGS